MSTNNREKFATQVDSSLLGELRQLAKTEGRQLQALIEEALVDLIEKRKHERPRTHVMEVYRQSLERRERLYRQLAK